MTDPTDLIAQADAWIDGSSDIRPSLVDMAAALEAERSVTKVLEGERDRLSDALAPALARAEAAEGHADALEAERDRLRDALTFYATGEWHIGYPGGVLFKGPGDDCPNHIDYGDRARAALTGEPQP